MNIAKVTVLILIGVFLCSICFADRIIVPFECYPSKLKEMFLDKGYKLDLNGSERTEDSWGFIENHGQEYYIYTYKNIEQEDFDIIKGIVFYGN